MWFNNLKTAMLLGALSGLLMFMGYVIGGQSGIQIAFIMALVMNGITYFFSDKIVLSMYGAQPLDKQRYANIYNIVERLSRKMYIPMPKLWLVNSPVANAFATGRNPSNASVAVTTGILAILNEEELTGVLAHELSHVKNRDILVSTVAATIATAISYMAQMFQYAAFWGAHRSDNNKDRSNSAGPLTMILIAIFTPIAASLMQLAISRSREYLADETGARCTHEPLALASALEKLHTNVGRAHFDAQDQSKASTASLFIVFPFTSGGIMHLFSTHPPMAERIKRLKAMSRT
jgi:heat shock protein HtpX